MNINFESKKTEDTLNNKPNALKGEHLNEGVKPIIGGIYDRSKLEEETIKFFKDFEKNADFVNFEYTSDDASRNRMFNSGKLTYVISECNNKNKYSHKYLNCTGVVVVGVDKETGKNISLLSHQNPEAFFKNKIVKENFTKDLIEDLDNLINKCIPGTIDAVILGGNEEEISDPDFDENFRFGIDDVEILMRDRYDSYQDSIKGLNFLISKKLNFTPTVISGPSDNFKTSDHSLSVYFDNENRRLYLVRPEQHSRNNESFEASQVENQIDLIKKKGKK